MMSSKPRKVLKSMRGGSPIRKDHLMKKAVRGSPPLRTSRPSTMKRLSPSIKRSHVMPTSSKNLHSPRLRSIASSSSPHRSVARHTIPSPEASMDRSRSFKRSKYEKRKMSSISPVRHPSSSPTSHGRDSSPYHVERYLSARPSIREERLEPAPPKKKIRREPDRFLPSSSLRKSSEIPFISDSGSSIRSEVTASHSVSIPMMSRNYLADPVHNERVERSYHNHPRSRHSPPPVSSNSSKRPPTLKNSYDSASGERYKTGASVSLFPPSEKSYAPTLNERFSSVDASRTEPRIRYSREDLEKITIDIRRNLRDCSPTLRQIVNPSDVKLVRRADEGHRPIFDREEIKKAPRDMREDAYYEKKVSEDSVYHPSHSMDLREVENYEITRHRFDSHHAPFHSSSGRSLSDRWQNSDARKESAPLDRDEREYERVHTKKNFVEVRNRSKSGDRDFRSERYTVGESARSRSDYHESQRRSVPIAPDPRSQIIPRKEISPIEMRRRLDMKRSGGERKSSPPVRSNSRNHFHAPPEKRYSESLSSREKHHSEHRSPPLESHKWSSLKSRPDIREEKLSDYSRRPDKYSYKSWPDKRDSSPPSSSYFEHSGRESLDSYRGRGSSRPFRASRGFRARGFRGAPRGSFRSRGSLGGGYRGSGSPRGRGAQRRGRYSPHLWEHDMYASLTPDRK